MAVLPRHKLLYELWLVLQKFEKTQGKTELP